MESTILTDASMTAVLADDGAPLQIDVGIDDRVFADLDERLDIGGLRVDEGDPLVHVPGVDPALDGAGGPGQLGPAVDPQQRLPVRVHQGFHPPALLPGNVDQVGEIDFAGDRAFGDFHQSINQKPRVKTIRPGVDLPDGQEVGAVLGIFGLDHRRHQARLVPHHPAVMGPVRPTRWSGR